MANDVRRKTLQNFNERSNKGLPTHVANEHDRQKLGSAKKLVDHEEPTHGGEESSPYYKDRNQNKPYYEPSYYTQYGGKFQKRANR